MVKLTFQCLFYQGELNTVYSDSKKGWEGGLSLTLPGFQAFIFVDLVNSLTAATRNSMTEIPLYHFLYKLKRVSTLNGLPQ